MFPKICFYFSIISLFLILSYHDLSAQDRIFARTYQSLVLPKDARDLEVWTTYQTGRAYLYNKIVHRVEYEVGLGSNLQTSLYLNSKQEFSSQSGNSVMEASEISFSNEWKYQLSDPVADGIGSALYAEFGIAPDEFELEMKLILDKKFGDNLIAFNATYEPEWESSTENGNNKTELYTNIEINLAYMYLMNKNLGIGFETRVQNLMVEGETQHSAFFAGPTVTYFGNKWWVVLNALPQITKIKAGLEEDKSRSLILSELEKVEYRIILAFNL